jgi:transcription factor C subunit 6
MGRTLRARKEVDYARLFTFDDDDPTAGGPAQPPVEDGSSGSEFAAEDEPEPDADEPDDDGALSDLFDPEPEPDPSPSASDVELDLAPRIRSKASVARAGAQRGVVQLAPGLARSSKRQMHARPGAGVHHRHRALPLYVRAGAVERLAGPPAPWPEGAVPVEKAAGGAGSERTGRAAGQNVGPGPAWELLEDRAWFAEAEEKGDGEDWRESRRRPTVYTDLAEEDVTVLDFECVFLLYSMETLPDECSQAWPFLPHEESDPPGTLPTMKCYMGPAGAQTLVELQTFQGKAMCPCPLPSPFLPLTPRI